jgi:hypothetical protein
MPPKAAASPSKKAAKPVKEKKEKKERGPSAPSSYIIFCKEKRPEVVTNNPEASFGEVGKLLGALWGALSEAEKAVSKIQSSCYTLFI